MRGIPKTMQHIAYCSGPTARALRRLGYTKMQFRILPWHKDTILELCDGSFAAVTMFPVDHNCEGSAGFLVEGMDERRMRILYTGDFKYSEKWYENMEDQGFWNDPFDEVYLDGTFYMAPEVTSEMTPGHSSQAELKKFLEKLGRDFSSCKNFSTLRLFA